MCAVAWQRITLDDSLPNVGVYSLLQDDAGFIWFGSTNIGIVRYDGHEFRPYPLPNINALGEVPDIDKLLFDRDGNLWAASWGYGLLRVDLGSNKVDSFAAGAKPNELYSPFVQSLLQDKQGRIWVGTNQGLNLIDASSGLQKLFDSASPQPLIHNRIWALAQTNDGKIWIATSRGLHYYTDSQGLSKAIIPHGEQSPDNEIRALLADGEFLWVASRAGLFRLNTRDLTLQRMPYYQGDTYPIINALAQDVNGDLLIGSFDGLTEFNTVSLQPTPLEPGGNSLAGVNIRSLYVDKTGLVWAGTRERGIYKARLFDGEFNDWSADSHFSAVRHTAAPVLSFYKDKEGLWLGRANGIDWQLTGSEQAGHFDSNARVNGFARDRQGRLWAATDTGLLRFDTGSGFVADNTVLTAHTLAARNVRDLMFASDGSMVLGMWGDGVVIDGPNGRHHLLKSISQLTTGDAVQDIEMIGDQLFIATRLTGLYRYSLQTAELVLMNRHVSGLSHKITCLARGPDDTLLICTKQGLQQLHLLTQQVRQYSAAQNLNSADLVGAYTDEYARIWLLTSQGLSVLPADSPRFIHYGPAEGISSPEMMFKAIAGEKGAVYVGTALGIDRISTTKIWQNRRPPTPVLSQVFIDQQAQPAKWQGQCCDVIQLLPGQSSVQLQFASLDFNDSGLNRIEMRLVGVDKQWQRLQSNVLKNYSNLLPGSYQLEFRAGNNHGVMSELFAVPMVVEPMWWQRKSVQLVALLSLLGGIVTMYLYRLKQLHKINQLLQDSVQAKAINEQQLEQKVVERTSQLRTVLSDLAESNVRLKHLDSLKDDFISTVSHELRTPLTSIHGAIRLLNSGYTDQQPQLASQLLQTAEENSTRLLMLINDLLDLQKFESGAMQLNKAHVDLQALVQQAIQGLSTYATRYQVTIAFAAEDAVFDVVVDPLRIRQVLDNLLSNAIKFSNANHQVEVRLQHFTDRLHVEIRDYGEGIPLDVQRRLFGKFVQADGSSNKTRYGSGLGLVICKRIIELHGGDIGFQSNLGQGSTFWFYVPIHQVADELPTNQEPQIRAWPTATME